MGLWIWSKRGLELFLGGSKNAFNILLDFRYWWLLNWIYLNDWDPSVKIRKITSKRGRERRHIVFGEFYVHCTQKGVLGPFFRQNDKVRHFAYVPFCNNCFCRSNWKRYWRALQRPIVKAMGEANPRRPVRLNV